MAKQSTIEFAFKTHLTGAIATYMALLHLHLKRRGKRLILTRKQIALGGQKGSTVTYHLRTLEKWGWISRRTMVTRTKRRYIVIRFKSKRMVTVPWPRSENKRTVSMMGHQWDRFVDIIRRREILRDRKKSAPEINLRHQATAIVSWLKAHWQDSLADKKDQPVTDQDQEPLISVGAKHPVIVYFSDGETKLRVSYQSFDLIDKQIANDPVLAEKTSRPYDELTDSFAAELKQLLDGNHPLQTQQQASAPTPEPPAVEEFNG